MEVYSRCFLKQVENSGKVEAVMDSVGLGLGILSNLKAATGVIGCWELEVEPELMLLCEPN